VSVRDIDTIVVVDVIVVILLKIAVVVFLKKRITICKLTRFVSELVNKQNL
jgi:hypothetical protein